MNAESAFGAYITTKNESAVTDATPHKLISLLLERISESVATASGAVKGENQDLLERRSAKHSTYLRACERS